MQLTFALICVVLGCSSAHALQCQDGSPIYEIGISKQGKKDVISETNNIRKRILKGTFAGQPKGRGILLTLFDNKLASKGREVSLSCKMQHITAKDSRWTWVGQNLYITWSSAKSSGQDWKGAVASWASESKDFIYPNKSRNNAVVGHYTQLIWQNSKFVGCDFVSFYDRNKPNLPYAKLYTCNYGPGGNIVGQAPYLRG